MTDRDVIVVGAGLAGLVATAKLVAAGRRVVLVDQEPAAHLGGQAHWSSGGLFLVNPPEQRRTGVQDSVELAWQDWLGSAGYDRPHDDLARRWAEGYVAFAAGEKRAWLRELGGRFLPAVGWAERGGGLATGHGNSVPRFHLVWGTGPALVAPFARLVRAGFERGRVRPLFRHRVDELTTTDGAVDGVRGAVLEPATGPRGVPTSRVEVGEFALRAQAVLVTSGGMGADHDLVRQHWPRDRCPPPRHMLSGLPDHVDGRMLGIAEKTGAHLTNLDRMWHYPEGLHNWNPLWTNHGIRLLPGPSSLWCDATGRRLPAPNFPGFDSLATLTTVLRSGHDHSWLVLNRRILKHELMLSGSEQNPDLTGQSVLRLLANAMPAHRDHCGTSCATAPTSSRPGRSRSSRHAWTSSRPSRWSTRQSSNARSAPGTGPPPHGTQRTVKFSACARLGGTSGNA